MYVSKVRKRAKIRNRYNQAPHLTQDTNGKVTTSQLDITNESQEKREPEKTPFRTVQLSGMPQGLASFDYIGSKVCQVLLHYTSFAIRRKIASKKIGHEPRGGHIVKSQK